MIMKKNLILPLLLCGICLSTWAQNTVLNVSGTVKDNRGRAIAGVVVNDGVHFTQTDKSGAWTLAPDTVVSKFISISTPAGYTLPQVNGLADGFYVPVREIAVSKKHDFVLEPRKAGADRFYYIAISDPQVRNAKEMTRWRTEAVEDMQVLVDSLKNRHEVVGMTLGDLVFDNMNLYDEYKESLQNMGMTVFQCIGNHDFDLRYQDLHNMRAGTSVYGEMVYNRYFGPTDYSFNMGKVHVVTLKNINYVGKKRYIECLTDEQIAWLEKDLSYVPKGSLVFLNMHAAGWNSVGADGNIRNAAQLEETLKGYNAHVFCGHTHFFQNNQVNPNLYEHNIGAACGAWWSSWVNRCGAPNGYLVVEVNGNDLKWHYKGTRRSFDYQFQVYKPGEFQTQSSFVIANVWDWDKDCRIVWYQDGKPMGTMEQFTGVDETYAATLKDRKQASETPHLFRAMPADGSKEIKIELTNRFGETYTQLVKL